MKVMKMNNLHDNLIIRADEVLASPETRSKAKALLLLNLCQVYSLFSPERAEFYFGQLAAVKKSVPDDQKSLFDNLQQTYGEKELSKGLAGEISAATGELFKKPTVSESEIRATLEGFEEKLKKSFSPFGKRAAWEKLIRAWVIIDRHRALELGNKLNAYERKNIVQGMNRQKALNHSEWTILEKATNQNKVAEIVLEILNDHRPVLNLPTNLIGVVFQALIDEFARSGMKANRFPVLFGKTDKLIGLVLSEESRLAIADALKIFFKYIPSGPAFEQDWSMRFMALEQTIFLGVKYLLITESNADTFVRLLPGHMRAMAKTRLAALLADESSAKSRLAELLETVDKKDEAEAYYLVSLVQRGLDELAYTMAGHSPRSAALIPRVCRALISKDAGSAVKVISKSDIEGDTFSELLLCISDSEKVAYLRDKTANGTKSLPGDIWINTENDPGKSGRFNSLDDLASEYTTRNPLYSIYRYDTPPDRQFSEYLRFSNFGEYSFNDTDKVLLGVLVNWAVTKPEEVVSLLEIMWGDMKPDQDLLKIDFLRNSILNRCAVVFSVMPDFMEEKYLAWLNDTLVKRAICWSRGKTDYTLQLPRTALSNLCIIGASAVSAYCPACKDRLTEMVVTRFETDVNIAEAAASLYNNDKELLDLAVPWKMKQDRTEAWQLGVVKNALGPLAQAVVTEELGKVKTVPVSEPGQAEKSCPGCGKENLPVARFCSECGSALNN